MRLGLVVILTLLLSSCGPSTHPTPGLTSGPNMTMVSNTSRSSVGLKEGSWTVVQQLSVDVTGPGHLQVSAYGGEPVTDILPSDDFRFTGLKTLIGISNASAAAPSRPATFVVACCGDDPFPYRVSAYSVGDTFYLSKQGTYRYVLYAMSPKEGDGKTSVRPGVLSALFVPD